VLLIHAYPKLYSTSLHAIQFAYSLNVSVSHAQKWKDIATYCTLKGSCIQSKCVWKSWNFVPRFWCTFL